MNNAEETPPMVAGAHSSESTQVRTESNGITNIIRTVFGSTSRFQDIVAVLALVVIIGQAVLLYRAYTHSTTQGWLADYDLNHFEAGPFARLQSKVDTQAALLRAFGPQNCKR